MAVVVTVSCSRSICTHFPCVGSDWPYAAINASQSHLTSLTHSLKMYNMEGYLYTHYMCSPVRVQHAYSDIRLHNTKLHNKIEFNEWIHHSYCESVVTKSHLQNRNWMCCGWATSVACMVSCCMLLAFLLVRKGSIVPQSESVTLGRHKTK